MTTNFCTRCGQPLMPGDTFCRRCGCPAQTAPPGPYRQRCPLLAPVCIIGALLLAVILFLALYAPESRLSLGSAVQFGGGTVSSTGGEIAIGGSGTPLDGLTITVPVGAFKNDVQFEISLNDIKSHSFGELFNPITPLISIDNGDVFADAPAVLQIPIDISDGEFALAFFYDRQAGTLEALPLLGEDKTTITVQTCRFTDIVVSKVLIERLLSPDSKVQDDLAGSALKSAPASSGSWSMRENLVLADSGFLPHVNDLQVVNNGSVINAYGHCAGQDIAAMLYFSHRGEPGWDQPLFGRFDNDGFEKTPGFTLDDAHVQRLASVLHSQYSTLLNESMVGIVSGATTFSYLGEDKTYYALIYAITMQEMPQYLSVRSTSGGHALIAYKVTAGRVYVADPNYPGDVRWINYNGYEFETYYSGANAEQATANATAYDTVYFRATNALVNKAAADALWQKVITGGDPGEGVFPPDIEITVCIGKDAAGANIMVPLTDGITLTTAQLASAGDPGAVGINIAWPKNQPFEVVNFYEGTGVLSLQSGQAVGTAYTLPLQPGQHDIGVAYYRKYAIIIKGKKYIIKSFINFTRCRVTVQDTAMTVEPAWSEGLADWPMEWTATVTGRQDNPVYTWDFGDGSRTETSTGYASHVFESPGTYEGKVTLSDGVTGEVLASAAFTAAVSEETPSPSVSVSGGLSNTELVGTWELVGDAYMLGTDGPVTPYDEYQHGSNLFYQFDAGGHMIDTLGYTYDYIIEQGQGQFKFAVRLEMSGSVVNYLLLGNDGRLYLPGISDETGAEFQVFEKLG